MQARARYQARTVKRFQNDRLPNRPQEEKEITMSELSLNAKIKVKLTPHGVDIYYHQNDELIEQMKDNKGITKIIERRMPTIDKDGFTEMQLWEFMELYGSHMNFSEQTVIEPLNIYF